MCLASKAAVSVLRRQDKVWNACGLRIGAIITDNKLCYEKSVAEYTANLSANTLGQYIFGALKHESYAQLHNWYEQQRDYYRQMIFELHQGFKEVEPDFIVSRPEASIYFVIDVRKVAKPGFDGVEFASWCAEHGAVSLDDGQEYTLLMAPLNGFYSGKKAMITQVRHNCAYPSVKIQTYYAWRLNCYLNYSELTKHNEPNNCNRPNNS